VTEREERTGCADYGVRSDCAFAGGHVQIVSVDALLRMLTGSVAIRGPIAEQDQSRRSTPEMH